MVGIAGWEPVSQPECSRRRVALAGRVIDQRSQAPIAGATVEIRQAVKSGKGTRTSGAALDRTLSHSDGLFYFLDLRSGTSYALVASNLRIEVTARGYKPVSQPAKLEPDQVQRVDVELKPEVKGAR